MTARVLILAAARRQARQRRTARGPEADCMTVAAVENNALRTRAALRLMGDLDSIPCDSEVPE